MPLNPAFEFGPAPTIWPESLMPEAKDNVCRAGSGIGVMPAAAPMKAWMLVALER
jgi:hypothetical protein